MAPAPTVIKAKLKIEAGDEIECLFNPKDYSVSKTNNYKADAKQGATQATPQFTGGTPWEMTLQLMFDSTLLKPAKSVKDVTGTLFNAMNASMDEHGKAKNTKRPPTITFQYGWFSFVGVCKNLKVAYTLFTPAGEPIRADVTLALMQYEQPKTGQNPTTRSESLQGAHVVRDGDSLPSDRPPRLRRPDPLARDRRGQRHRRPAEPAQRPHPRRAGARRMSPPVNLVAGVTVKVGGAPLDPSVAADRVPRAGQPDAARRVLVPRHGPEVRARRRRRCSTSARRSSCTSRRPRRRRPPRACSRARSRRSRRSSRRRA